MMRIKIPKHDGNRFLFVRLVGNHFLIYPSSPSHRVSVLKPRFERLPSGIKDRYVIGQPDPLDDGKVFSSR
jgi:hypothetical protein